MAIQNLNSKLSPTTFTNNALKFEVPVFMGNWKREFSRLGEPMSGSRDRTVSTYLVGTYLRSRNPEVFLQTDILETWPPSKLTVKALFAPIDE